MPDQGYLGLYGQYGIAHRGGSLEHLENSRSAFAHSLSLGFEVLETDVQATADGVLVVTHDATLQRTASDRRRVNALTWSELSTMSLLNGEAILSFDELVELHPTVRLNIDPKSDAALAPLIARLQADTDLQSRVCIGSFETRRLLAVRSKLPGVATSLGSSEIRRLVLAVRAGVKFRWPDSAVAAQVPVSAMGVRIVTEAFIDFVQSAGRHVHVWTVDEAAEMNRLYDLGVNGVMTDYPTRLKEVLIARGLWS